MQTINILGIFNSYVGVSKFFSMLFSSTWHVLALHSFLQVFETLFDSARGRPWEVGLGQIWSCEVHHQLGLSEIACPQMDGWYWIYINLSMLIIYLPFSNKQIWLQLDFKTFRDICTGTYNPVGVLPFFGTRRKKCRKHPRKQFKSHSLESADGQASVWGAANMLLLRICEKYEGLQLQTKLADC